MKFTDGLMIHTGFPVTEYVDTAVRHVLLRQGVIGLKVKIMLPHDPTGKVGPKTPYPDIVEIREPKEEEPYVPQAVAAAPAAAPATPAPVAEEVAA